MRIVVLVKYVPDVLAGPVFDADCATDRSIQGLLSELDEYPLEAARRLAETAGAEVIAVSVGPPRAGDAAPLQHRGRHTGLSIDLGTFSRRRPLARSAAKVIG